MGDLIRFPGSFCDLCGMTYTKTGWNKQSAVFGFCCQKCVNKSARLVRRHNRRARIAGCFGKLYAFQWLSLVYSHDFQCLGCRATGELTLDHIRPLSSGGHNMIWNVQCLCKICHARKDNIQPGKRSHG